MGSFGKKLKREREMRGIALQEIARHTKISTRMLEAIEEDRFDLLPGGIFSRAFVLHYARYLGLNEEQAGAEFDLAVGTPGAVSIEAVAAQRESLARQVAAGEGLARRRLLLIAGLSAALVLSVVALRALWQPWLPLHRAPAVAPPPRLPAPPSPRALGASPAATGAAPAQEPSGAPAAPPAAPPAQAPVSGQPSPPAPPSPRALGASPAATGAAPAQEPSGAPAAPPAAPPAQAPVSGQPSPPAPPRLQLQIDTLDNSRVEVIADGRTVFRGTMRKGQMRRVSAESRMEVRASNAGAVVLTLNGETQPPLGRMGEPKTVVFTREDLKQP
jgi:cytoskeleton protein RodZ